MREIISSRVEDHLETEVWFAIMRDVADDVRTLVRDLTNASQIKEQEIYIAREDQLEESSGVSA